MKNQYRVNEQIRARDVRVVSDGGAEVMPARKALELARQQELELIVVLIGLRSETDFLGLHLYLLLLHFLCIRILPWSLYSLQGAG